MYIINRDSGERTGAALYISHIRHAFAESDRSASFTEYIDRCLQLYPSFTAELESTLDREPRLLSSCFFSPDRAESATVAEPLAAL